MGCEILPDGYTLSDTCLGANVVFRPMPFGDHDAYLVAMAYAGEKRKEVLAQKMVERIASWDVTKDGAPQELTAANFNALPREVGERIIELVTGRATPDGGPTPEESEKNSEAA